MSCESVFCSVSTHRSAAGAQHTSGMKRSGASSCRVSALRLVWWTLFCPAAFISGHPSGYQEWYCATPAQCVLIKHTVEPALEIREMPITETPTHHHGLFTFSATYQIVIEHHIPYLCSRHGLSSQKITGKCMYLWKWWDHCHSLSLILRLCSDKNII